MAKLVILDGKFKGDVYPLHSRNIIGRHPECSLIIKEPSVSGNHCKIEQVGTRDYSVTDLGSSNGTFVNENQITSHVLQPGDVIFVGNVRLLFQHSPDNLNQSTVIMEMDEYLNMDKKLFHCNKPMAKEWTYCPYCSDDLRTNPA